MNPYEITFILRPDQDEEQTRGAADQINARVQSLGGEIIAMYAWNPPRRRMAYPIRDYGDGFYVTTTFRLPIDGLKELERFLQLNTNVLRYLIVQATDLNITQSQQRAQQAAARAAGPQEQAAPAPQGPAPQAPQPVQQQPAAPQSGTTAPPVQTETTPQPAPAQPEPVAAAPAAETQE